VARVYSDVDISAWAERTRPDGSLAPLHRPEFEQALSDLRDGSIQGLAFWKVDRFCRNRKDFERLWDLVKTRGVKLISVHEAFDTSTPHGEFVFALMVGIAKLESDTLSLRRKSLLQVQAERGRAHSGGRRAFGFERDGATLNLKEAAVIRWAAEQLLDGASLAGVCRQLLEQGVTTPAGQPWLPSKLARMLRSPRVAGKRSHHGTLYPGDWTAILDPETQTRLAEVLDRRAAVNPRPGPATRNLLSGIARCGAEGCGKPMWIRYRGPGRPGKDSPGSTRRYSCVKPPNGRGCGRVSVDAAWLNDLIVESVIQRLCSDEFADALDRALAGDGDQGMAARLAADKEALVELGRDRYVRRTIDDAIFLAAKAELEQRIAEADRALKRDPRAAVLVDLPRVEGELRRVLEGKTPEQLRLVVAAILERLEIKPAAVRGRNRLDEGRIDPEWRF
jgi:site-specific DNA recombinase